MDPQFKDQMGFVAMMTILLFTAGPMAVVIIGGLLLPGRKGKMRTVRAQEFKNDDIDQIWQLMVMRLRQMEFVIKPTGMCTSLRATRPKRPIGEGTTQIHTHASKPLEVELRLERSLGRVAVHAVMWTPDLVILDTGEGAHIDQRLDLLLAPDTDVPPPMPEPVPNLTMKATCALTTGLMLLPAALLLLHPWCLLPRAVGYYFGFLTGVTSAVVLGLTGLADNIRRPKEIRGKGVALLGIVLALLAASAATGIFCHEHGQQFLQWMLEQKNK